MSKATKQARLTEAYQYPQFQQALQLHRLLKVYAGLDKNETWQELVSFADNGISLKALALTFKTPESNMSKRLAPLRETGLVLFNQNGKEKMFYPNFDVCLQVEKFINFCSDMHVFNPAQITPAVIEYVEPLADPLAFLIWKALEKDGLSINQIRDRFNIGQFVAFQATKSLLENDWAEREPLKGVEIYGALNSLRFWETVDTCFVETGTIKFGIPAVNDTVSDDIDTSVSGGH